METHQHCWPLTPAGECHCSPPVSAPGRAVGSEPGCGWLASEVTAGPLSVHTHSSPWTSQRGCPPGLGTSWCRAWGQGGGDGGGEGQRRHMVSAPGSCYLYPEGQGLRTFPGVVAMGDAGKRTPAHIGGGLGPATPLQAPGKGSKWVREKGLELVWWVWVQGLRRPHVFPFSSTLLSSWEKDKANTRY